MARGPVIPDDKLRSEAETLLKSKPWMSRNEFIKEMHASWGRLRALGVKFPSKKTPMEVKTRNKTASRGTGETPWANESIRRAHRC